MPLEPLEPWNLLEPRLYDGVRSMSMSARTPARMPRSQVEMLRAAAAANIAAIAISWLPVSGRLRNCENR